MVARDRPLVADPYRTWIARPGTPACIAALSKISGLPGQPAIRHCCGQSLAPQANPDGGHPVSRPSPLPGSGTRQRSLAPPVRDGAPAIALWRGGEVTGQDQCHERQASGPCSCPGGWPDPFAWPAEKLTDSGDPGLGLSVPAMPPPPARTWRISPRSSPRQASQTARRKGSCVPRPSAWRRERCSRWRQPHIPTHRTDSTQTMPPTLCAFAHDRNRLITDSNYPPISRSRSNTGRDGMIHAEATASFVRRLMFATLGDDTTPGPLPSSS